MLRIVASRKKNNFIKEMIKSGKNTRLRSGVAVLGMVFVLVFAFNAVRPNIGAAISKDELDENRKTVENIQTAEVKTVEQAVKQIEKSFKYNGSAGIKVKYRRLFKNSVILGDSLTEGLVVYGWLPKTIVFSEVGGSIVYNEDLFKKAAKTRPEEAYIAYGMNDMGNFGGDEKAFVKKYIECIDTFLKASPDTSINICSITTPTEKAQEGNKSIRNYKKFNKALKKMCKDKGYNYIDVSDILPEHEELYAGDGIHAAPDYYPLWMKRVIARS